jgi:hypothetical protein
MRKLLAVLFLVFLTLQSFASADELKWFKGCMHCHTNMVDGDSSPERVARWYKDHLYNFLVISDHNVLTNPKDIYDVEEIVDSTFILIPGEEVLQYDIDAIRATGGIAQINHPLRQYSFDDRVISKLKNVNLMEVYNFNKDNHNFAAGGHPGMEEVWDRLLSMGKLYYGTASDDAHWFSKEFNLDIAIPGKARIVVKAPALTEKDILDSLSAGRFYCSDGVFLKDLKITGTSYALEIEQHKDHTYTTCFTGKDGKILSRVDGTKATYTFKGDELYVRAKVMASSGEFAISQPFFLKKH